MTARSAEYRDSSTGTLTTRPASPSTSTVDRRRPRPPGPPLLLPAAFSRRLPRSRPPSRRLRSGSAAGPGPAPGSPPSSASAARRPSPCLPGARLPGPSSTGRPVGQRRERRRRVRGQGHQVRPAAVRERQVEEVGVVDRVEDCAADRNARYRPSVVNTGSVSMNRPSVTSTTRASASRASRIRRSGGGPGCDQASQAESGDEGQPGHRAVLATAPARSPRRRPRRPRQPPVPGRDRHRRPVRAPRPAL